VFSGHDHVYSRAENDGVRYFVSGGGGAPLYPRRPKSSQIDLEAVKKFERVFHYLRITVSGPRVEVSGVRADGTLIETTTWMDPIPEQPAPPPVVAQAGAQAKPAAPPVVATVNPPDADQLWWLAAGAVLLALLGSVIVVRTLR
jgi:hypothetical protein